MPHPLSLEDIARARKQALAPFWTQRITVCAMILRYGTRPIYGTTRWQQVILAQQVYHDDLLVADHIWLPCESELRDLCLHPGEWFQFEGRVIRYVRKSHPNLFCYAFDDIRSPERLFSSEMTHE